jgi:hypothetical protein
MVEVSNRRLVLEWVLYLVISAIGCAAVHVSLSRSAPVAVLPVAIFYGPAWLITNAFFGGIHGAPRWSYAPSILIAVLGQNALFWWVSRFIRNKLLERQQTGRRDGP